MNFPNVQVLNASSRSEFFGDNVRWKTVYELSVEGNFLALQSTNSIHSLVNNQESDFFNSSIFEDSIVINGTNFGEGYVSNFSSPAEGPDVKNKRYTATIIIRKEGNLNTIVTEGLGQVTKSDFQYIESFSESSVFNKGIGVKDSYSQNINLNLISRTPGSQKSIAESIIKSFINTNLLTSLIQGQYQKTSIKKYYTQSYDEINNAYNVNVNFEFAPRSITPGNAEGLIIISNVKKDYLTGGILNISENVECIGNQNKDSEKNYLDASKEINNLISTAFSRLSSYVDAEHNPLIDQPINKSFVSSPFEGRAGYSITFSNSKEVIADSGYWEFSINFQLVGPNTDNIIANEQGTIIGSTELNVKQDKYKKALSIWNEKKTSIKTRITSENSSFPGDAKIVSSEENHNEIEGSISYNYTYNHNYSLFTEESASKISKKNVSVTQEYDRKIFSTFNIVGFKEIIQVQKNLLPNNTTINVILNGKSDTSINDYLSEAKILVSQNILPETYKELENVNYDFSPSAREFKLTASYFKMENV